MLTVGILGEDLVGDVGGIANTNRVDGTNSDDVLLLWFDSIINPKLKLFDGSVVDPQPLELWAGLSHFNMVASDRAATILGWRLPGDVDVLPAGIRNGQLKRRRWSTWREEDI